MEIPRHPKILQLSNRHLKTLFDGPVDITEKVDGSQFSFGKVEGNLICRSKRRVLDNEEQDKLFKPGVTAVKEIENELPNNIFFYGETLAKPKHNVLEYNTVPHGHVVLFGGYDMHIPGWLTWQEINKWANTLTFDTVPLIYQGKLDSPSLDYLEGFMKRESFLGGPFIEGIVIANYAHDFFVDDQYFPYQKGKLVSADFKEVHDKDWKKKAKKYTWEDFIASYQTEARWLKAVQRMQEEGSITYEPKDIGTLIKYVKQDVMEEEVDNIKDFLWKNFGEDLIRKCTHGLPEFYKEYLLKKEGY